MSHETVDADAVLPQSYLLSPFVLRDSDPVARYQQLVRVGGLFLVTGGILALTLPLLPGGALYQNPRGVSVVGLVALLAGLAHLLFPTSMKPLHVYLFLYGGIVLISLSAYFVGPREMAYAAMLYMWPTTLGFSAFKRRWMVPYVVLIGFGYGAVLLVHRPSSIAVNNWIFMMTTVVVTGSLFTLLVQHFARVAIAHSAARAEVEQAKSALSLLNRELEDKVAGKIEEVERLSELRRLVSARVADALLGSDRVLEPHRREIAVFFIDLRGFTSFAMETEPEEVIRVLEEFYEILGTLFEEYAATVGAFEADGVMAYFNDPIPVEDPAQQAVSMALDVRVAMGAVIQRWAARGYELHFGIGLAVGYATLGLVGFEGRQDYTAIGTVVNLASRLCDEADKGDILIDRKTYLAVAETIDAVELDRLQLKGFRDPVPVFRAIERKTSRQELQTGSTHLIA